MNFFRPRIARKDWVFAVVMLLLCAGLYMMPPAEQIAEQSGTSVPAVVREVDNTLLQKHGLLLYGSQLLRVEVRRGEFAGRSFPAVNEMRGQLELDKVFSPGDRISVNINERCIPDETVLVAKDFDRSLWTLILFAGFCLLLIAFGAWTGVKALFSFIFSCLIIFRVIIPLTLKGIPAAGMIFICVMILTAVIIFLVAGINKKAAAAVMGASSGVLAGLIMSHLFGSLLHINGAAMPYVQSLLYTGYETLDLADIFVGALILGCSGAVMDLAMDIASAVEEVARHNPELSAKELTASGLRVGRSVVGTMTTTLLLAYSGGYLTLLMMFAAQGTVFFDIINNPLVAAETVKTLIGSFSLVLVAPLTAVIGGWMFGSKH